MKTISTQQAMTVGIKRRPDDPVALANKFDAADSRDGTRPLAFHRGKWYRYSGTHFAPDSTLRARLSAFMELLFCEQNLAARANAKEGESGPTKLTVTNSRLRDTMGRLEDASLLADEIQPPCWLRGTQRPEVLSLHNGLLDPVGVTLLPHTPDYYSHGCGEYDFEPEAKCPTWDAFMLSVWPDDPASIDTLAEWFGLMLTKITRFQKILLVQGPPRSGKGTIADVLTRLVGSEQVVAKGLTTLGSNFGLANLVGKTVCIIPEARVNWRTDLIQAVTRLVSISGEDRIDTDVKNRDEVNAKSNARFMITSNSPLDLGDSSDAVASRLLVLRQTVSFKGREDNTLRDRLGQELPGVLNWALAGLGRLLARGKFEQPESGRLILDAFRAVNDRIGAFVRQTLVLDPQGATPKRELYGLYQQWCCENGRKPLSHQHFGTELFALGDVSEARPRQGSGGTRVEHYCGVRPRTAQDDKDDRDSAGAVPAPVES